MQKYKPFYF